MIENYIGCLFSNELINYIKMPLSIIFTYNHKSELRNYIYIYIYTNRSKNRKEFSWK